MLKDTRALVAKAAQDGKAIEQMKQEHLLAKYEELGKGFIKTDAWIELLSADVQHKDAEALPTRTTATPTNVLAPSKLSPLIRLSCHARVLH